MNTTQPEIRFLANSYLYNMLQDFRHLLIFDFRQNFQEKYIRDSFNVHNQVTAQRVIQIIQLADKKAVQKQTKYQNLQKVRRYFFVGTQKIDPKNKQVAQVLQCLSKFQTKQDKYYALNGSFESFAQTYPFTLLSQQKLQPQNYSSQQQFQKYSLYPYSKFPSQIVPNKLYLSNIYCSNSQRQLKDIGINVLIDFVGYKPQEKIPDFKQALQKYMQIPINSEIQVAIDFDEINKEMDKLINDGKVLLYCRDGESISPAFAISYLMYKANMNVQMATLKVCQAISRVQLNKWIYTQLLVYKPKK